MSKGTLGQDSSPSDSNSSTTGADYTRRGLHADTARETAKHLPLNQIAKLARTSRSNYQLFQPILNEAKAVHPLLTAVVLGNTDELARMVAANPGLFFKKGQVTDPDGTTFYDVSPDLLIFFLADNDMRDKIEPLIPAAYKAIRRQQHAEIANGGADLVKMDKDPTSVPFEEVTRFITSFNLNPPNPATEVAFPLLENEDGIIFYNNQFYYANKKTETVVPIILSQEEQEALEKLKTSFIDMEMNSSRRSSNDEHVLIASRMHRELKRRGIHYERNAHGADLVKMDTDPKSISFSEVTRSLENPDGILFYNNQFYYANKETETVELIKPKLGSEPKQAALDRAALEAFKASLASMEQNTRRSNNAEHKLIARTMNHELIRPTIRYCDSHVDFNRLLNAYRKCIRLYQEQKWAEGDNTWRREVGGAQRNVIWLLQRYCEENRPFYPLPDFKASPFQRGFNVYNFVSGRNETVLGDGLLAGFGSDFGIYKGGRGGAAGVGGGGRVGWGLRPRDLVAVSRLVESARTNVVEFTVAQDLQADNAQANLHRGPG
ncbi:MAG: hypothetical protein P4L65_10495 [Legionella sp.]|nr:hypothetical protein [Legionella sp.]